MEASAMEPLIAAAATETHIASRDFVENIGEAMSLQPELATAIIDLLVEAGEPEVAEMLILFNDKRTEEIHLRMKAAACAVEKYCPQSRILIRRGPTFREHAAPRGKKKGNRNRGRR